MRRCAGGWIALAAAAALISAPQLAAGPVLFPSSRIAVGMTGVGKTVVLGTQISEFQVKVLGILRNAGPAGDLVLFRASGPAIREFDGLAAGMSGSPIYLNGRLAGAFSYSFQAVDPSIGLFTPIEDMMKVLSPSRGGDVRGRTYAISPVRIGDRTIRQIAFAPSPLSSPETLVAVPAATPLFVSGLGETEQNALGTALRPMGLLPMQGSGQVRLPASLPLEPGSAVGIALMRGDISAYAIGTLTYRDGNRILAFGHPFTGIGHTSYLMTNATILQTVRGTQRNLKVGAAGTVIGLISEDRPAAVAGTVGLFPRVFGVRMKVTDEDTGGSRRFAFQVVDSKEFAATLVGLGAQGVVGRVLNRSGEGTARVRIVVRARALPRPIVRENCFYSVSDIASRSLAEIPAALHLVFENDFADVGPADMDIDVRITGRRETATITEVEMPKETIVPGTPAHVRVTLRPFRSSPVVQEVELKVPPEFPAGPAMLIVRAGGTASPAPAGGGTVSGQAPEIVRSLTDAIATFEKGEKNTDVVAELVSQRPAVPIGSSRGPSRVSSTATTSWVLQGRIERPILIGGGPR